MTSGGNSGQFVVNAPGGFWLGSNGVNTTATQPNVFLYTTSGAYLSNSGVWTNNSDRNLKTTFEPIDPSSLLARLGQLPIASWQYKVDPSSVRHIGPMAQDFYLAFKLGDDNKHISTVDESGVALAGVQALYRLGLKKDAQIHNQQAQIRTLRSEVKELQARESKLARQVLEMEKVQRQMAALEARLAQVEARTAKPSSGGVEHAGANNPAPRGLTIAKVPF
jgi:hypothetical protein